MGMCLQVPHVVVGHVGHSQQIVGLWVETANFLKMGRWHNVGMQHA